MNFFVSRLATERIYRVQLTPPVELACRALLVVRQAAFWRVVVGQLMGKAPAKSMLLLRQRGSCSFLPRGGARALLALLLVSLSGGVADDPEIVKALGYSRDVILSHDGCAIVCWSHHAVGLIMLSHCPSQA